MPCDTKSVEGVALCEEGGDHRSPLTRGHCSVASGASVSNGFGAGYGRGGSKEAVQLSLGESIGQDESPVFHAASANHDR